VRFHGGHGIGDPFTGATVDGRVDQDAHVQAVHVFDQPFEAIRRHVALVIVDIDERKLRASWFVLGDAEGRFGFELFDGDTLGSSDADQAEEREQETVHRMK